MGHNNIVVQSYVNDATALNKHYTLVHLCWSDKARPGKSDQFTLDPGHCIYQARFPVLFYTSSDVVEVIG